MKMRSAAVLTAVVSLAATASVAGCGSEKASDNNSGQSHSGKSAETASLKNVADATTKAQSAKVSGSVKLGKKFSTTYDGALSWKDGTVGALTMKMHGSMLKGGSGTGPKSMQARYTKDAVYLNLASVLGKNRPPELKGKSWMKVGYDDAASASGMSGNMLESQMRQNNPRSSVQLLLDSGNLKKVGTEKVRGTQAQHYKGTVNTADLAAKQSSSMSKKDRKQQRQQLKRLGVKKQRVELWVNGDDLPVRTVTKANTAQGAMTTRTDYRDFGTSVQADPPESKNVLDFGKEMRKLRKGHQPGSGATTPGSAPPRGSDLTGSA